MQSINSRNQRAIQGRNKMRFGQDNQGNTYAYNNFTRLGIMFSVTDGELTIQDGPYCIDTRTIRPVFVKLEKAHFNQIKERFAVKIKAA